MSSKLKVPPLCVIIGTVPLLPVASVPSLTVAEVHGNIIIYNWYIVYQAYIMVLFFISYRIAEE